MKRKSNTNYIQKQLKNQCTDNNLVQIQIRVTHHDNKLYIKEAF